MQAELLRKDGHILLMETGSDFVDVLTNCLNSPLGAVATAANDNAFSQLQDSLSLLRPAVYTVPKSEAVPPPLDLEYVTTTLPPEVSVVVGSMVVEGDPESGPFSVTGTGSSQWCRGAAFMNCSVGHFGFELTIEEPEAGVQYMLGIAPEEMMSIQQLLQQNMFQNFGYYLSPNSGYWYLYSEGGDRDFPMPAFKGSKVAPGDRVGMRFTPRPVPKLEFQIRGEEWQEAKFKKPIKGNVKYCPVLLMAQAGKAIRVESCAVKKPATKFHPMAKFVITNELEVTESSALKALQITQQQGVEMKDVQVVSVLIKPRHLQRMLQRAFAGHDDMLTYAFEDHVAANTAASCSSSENSYVVPK